MPPAGHCGSLDLMAVIRKFALGHYGFNTRAKLSFFVLTVKTINQKCESLKLSHKILTYK